MRCCDSRQLPQSTASCEQVLGCWLVRPCSGRANVHRQNETSPCLLHRGRCRFKQLAISGTMRPDGAAADTQTLARGLHGRWQKPDATLHSCRDQSTSPPRSRSRSTSSSFAAVGASTTRSSPQPGLGPGFRHGGRVLCVLCSVLAYQKDLTSLDFAQLGCAVTDGVETS